MKKMFIYFCIFLVLTALYMNHINERNEEIFFIYSGSLEEKKMLNNVLKQHKKVSIVKTNNNIVLDSNENPYKIYNIEKFTDVITSNCMTRRPKCILCHPDNMFYTIVNKVNVDGYPFEFENPLYDPNYDPLMSFDNQYYKNLNDGENKLRDKIDENK